MPLRARGLGPNISKTQYRGLVPKVYQQETAYGESNGHVAVTDVITCGGDRCHHVTLKGRSRDSNTLIAQYGVGAQVLTSCYNLWPPGKLT